MSIVAKSISHSNIAWLRDLMSLTKPRITLMTLLLAYAGVMHGAYNISPFGSYALISLLAICFLVSGSSALNMYLERLVDGKMERTKNRPLPAKRLDKKWALILGIGCVFCAVLLFAMQKNILALFVGLFALIAYVFVYTPLKQKSWLSLLIGSIPGAMPVMLGYVSFAHTIDRKAVALFLWAFLWQIPHFLSISIFRETEYTQAGFKVFSAKYSVRICKNTIFFSSWALVLSSLFLYSSSVLSMQGLITSLVVGAWFLYTCYEGLNTLDVNNWARKTFKASLIYQSLLFLLIIIEALIGRL